MLCVTVRTSGGEQFLSAVMGGATGQLTRQKVEPTLVAERHLSAPALTVDDGHLSASPLDDQFFDMLIRCQVRFVTETIRQRCIARKLYDLN